MDGGMITNIQSSFTYTYFGVMDLHLTQLLTYVQEPILSLLQIMLICTTDTTFTITRLLYMVVRIPLYDKL